MDRLHIVPIAEDSPFHLGGTSLYLVAGRFLTLIDTGNVDQVGARAVLQFLKRHPQLGPLSLVLITHSHRDHVGGLSTLYDALRPRVLANPLAGERLREVWGFEHAAPLADEQVLDLGELRLRVLHAPGHSRDHLCFFEPEAGMLFTGDLVLGRGSATVSDVAACLSSLERLARLRPRVLCPGHGPVVNDAEPRIQEYIQHRLLREEQLLVALGASPKTSQELTRLLYADVDPRLFPAAERNVQAHLRKLLGDGRVKAIGDAERPSYRLS